MKKRLIKNYALIETWRFLEEPGKPLREVVTWFQTFKDAYKTYTEKPQGQVFRYDIRPDETSAWYPRAKVCAVRVEVSCEVIRVLMRAMPRSRKRKP